MLSNYLKIAFRSLSRYKFFSFINILGLSVSIAVGMMMFATAFREFSYDRFHENADDLYMLYRERNISSGIDIVENMPMPLREMLEADFPDLVASTRIVNGFTSIRYGEKTIQTGIDYVDADFMQMFSFPVVRGSQSTALSQVEDVVLSEKMAKKIFGDEEPIGQSLEFTIEGQKKNYVVAAVAKKLDQKSSIRFDVLLRVEEYPNYQEQKNDWDDYFMAVFVQLPKGLSAAEFEEQLKTFTNQYFAEEIEQLKASNYVSNPDGSFYRLKLQAVKSLHFASFLPHSAAVNPLYPISFLMIGLFILIIACGNFINLSLGTSVRRAMEVGVRKVLGAGRRQIVYQFWSETMIIIIIALSFALMAVQWLLPHYNALLKDDVNLFNPFILTALGLVLLIVTFGAGAYPAMVISRFQPAAILKGQTKVQKPGILRNVLVIAQFATSIFLIACTFIILQQIHFMRNQSLGYNKEQVISIPISNDLDDQQIISRFRNEMQGQPSILEITAATRNLGLGLNYSNSTSTLSIDQKGKLLQFRWTNVDYDFLECLDIQLLEGRSFDRQMATDTTAVIINEKLAALLEEEEVVGSWLETNPKHQVIGVIKNYHMDPMNMAVAPEAIVIDPDWGYHYIFTKVASDNMPKTMALLKTSWAKIAPGKEFQGSFLDENIARQYEQEEVMSRITTGSAILAIFLSCLGLFAMALLTIVQRTKEIGIRKVLGASIPNIVLLLSGNFLRLVGIAALIAIPLAWYGMRIWLQEYHYHIELHWWVFALAGILAILIAFATVSAQSIKAALSNPIDALRTE